MLYEQIFSGAWAIFFSAGVQVKTKRDWVSRWKRTAAGGGRQKLLPCLSLDDVIEMFEEDEAWKELKKKEAAEWKERALKWNMDSEAKKENGWRKTCGSSCWISEEAESCRGKEVTMRDPKRGQASTPWTEEGATEAEALPGGSRRRASVDLWRNLTSQDHHLTKMNQRSTRTDASNALSSLQLGATSAQAGSTLPACHHVSACTSKEANCWRTLSVTFCTKYVSVINKQENDENIFDMMKIHWQESHALTCAPPIFLQIGKKVWALIQCPTSSSSWPAPVPANTEWLLFWAENFPVTSHWLHLQFLKFQPHSGQSSNRQTNQTGSFQH